MSQGTILLEIANERFNQDRKWGEQNHNLSTWYTILGEEFGEVGKDIQEYLLRDGSRDTIREELIQVAAVAVAMIECMDRRDSERG